jgi:hypothetical protein
MDKYMFFFFLFFLVGNRLHQQPLFPLLPISGQQDNRVTGITQGKDFELRGPDGRLTAPASTAVILWAGS